MIGGLRRDADQADAVSPTDHLANGNFAVRPGIQTAQATDVRGFSAAHQSDKDETNPQRHSLSEARFDNAVGFAHLLCSLCFCAHDLPEIRMLHEKLPFAVDRGSSGYAKSSGICTCRARY